MSNGNDGWLRIILALVIGLIVGWLLHRAPPPAAAFGSNSILVGPGADQLTIKRLNVAGNDIVWWNSRNPKRVLWIEFEKDIFEGATPGLKGRFRVQCAGATCYSGDIKK